MSNQSPDRGFNTVNDSTVSRRQTKALRQKILLILIISIVILMVITLLILAIGAIAQAVKDNGQGGKPLSNDEIEWETLTVSEADTKHGALVVVNKDLAYDFPEDNEHLIKIFDILGLHESPRPYTTTGISSYMAEEAMKALDAMLTDFSKANKTSSVAIHYAYRTYEEQEELNSATPAGHSDHHTGYGCALRMLDPSGDKSHIALDDDSYEWLSDNAAKYGFIIRYPEEKSDLTGVSDYLEYFRYVGVPHATLMTQNNLCMEEYAEYLSKEAASDDLTVKGADGQRYIVRYYDVDGDTEIKVPSNCTYTVSGTNQGSVVVTVNLADPIETDTDRETESESRNTAKG